MMKLGLRLLMRTGSILHQHHPPPWISTEKPNIPQSCLFSKPLFISAWTECHDHIISCFFSPILYHFLSTSLKKIMKRFTLDCCFFLSAWRQIFYTGAVQFINIYIYHDVKTKRLFLFFFLIYIYVYIYVGAMQGHGIIHGNGMNSK